MPEARTHRTAAPRRRTIRTVRTEGAGQALGPVAPGMEVFCLTFGQFSLIDALCYLISQAGPAEVVLSTWTAAEADLTRTHALLETAQVSRFRLILDHNMMRRPNARALVAHVDRLFGSDSVRTTRSHAKYATIRSADFTLAVRTSMNLNHNPRLENIEVSDDPALCEFLEGIADALWSDQEAGRPMEEFPSIPTSLTQVRTGKARAAQLFPVKP